MVSVESVETSVFLRGLVGSFPELWQRACNESMVVLVPQVASLESERISLQNAGELVCACPPSFPIWCLAEAARCRQRHCQRAGPTTS